MPEFYWRARLAKGASYVPVKTFFDGPLIDGEILDRSPRWQAVVRGETTGRAILFGDECPIEIEGQMMLRNLERINEAEYNYLLAHATWATQHASHLPDAQPKTAINWNKTRPVF